jgi:hypothetical protein
MTVTCGGGRNRAGRPTDFRNLSATGKAVDLRLDAFVYVDLGLKWWLLLCNDAGLHRLQNVIICFQSASVMRPGR